MYLDLLIKLLPLIDGLKAKPAMLVVGMKDGAIDPQVQLADFKSLFPNGPITILPDAGHFCQEDAPETIVALIQQFIHMSQNLPQTGNLAEL